ncbi:MAG: serine hydrolase domain-containing protein [Acidithiobacillus sp.]
MNPLKHIAPAALGLCGLLCVVTAQASRLSGIPNSSSLFNQYITKTLNKESVPGAIIGIWQAGQPAYIRAFGVADIAQKKPFSTRMIMPVGGIAASFTATIVLELAKNHKISLTSPVSHYLPDVPDGDQITVADLVQMRSGLTDYLRDPAYLREVAAHPDNRLSPQQLLSFSFKHPLLFRPGSRFDYSSTNNILLGLIIEKVTGRPLSQVMAEQLLRPYKLRETAFSTSFAEPFLNVKGYHKDADGQKMTPVEWNPSLYWASGAMTSSVGDLKRWAKINADHIISAPVAAHAKSAADGMTSMHYLWGSLESHGWIGNVSRMAGFETVAIYSPKYKDTIVIMMNSDAQEQGSAVAAHLAEQISKFITPQAIFQPLPQ